jgi:prepilin-type N-terminal cleavage/methylation domain-containing protein
MNKCYFPNKSPLKLKKAFTLIELLIVVFVIATLFGFGYANYRNYIRRQSLISAARQMEGVIKQAQSYALSARKPETCTTVLDGYKFKLNADNSYEIAAYCQKDISIEGSKVYLPEGITMSFNRSSVMYKTLGHGTDLTDTLVITLLQEATQNTAVVRIISSGGVTYGFQ